MKQRSKIVLSVLAALLLALAWRIYTWGEPIPAAFESVGPGRYRAMGAAGTIYVAGDTDGDGTADRVYPEGKPEHGFRRPAANDSDTRWLILCLDGVPYAEVKALWDAGHFREFFSPSELTSTFPSESETALTELLHAEPVPGYEHRYFSRTENRLRGGIGPTLTGENIPYFTLLDYDMPGILKGFNFTLPRKGYRADLGRFRKRFVESNAKIFLAHLASTDALYHVLTREEMRMLLLEVDSVLRELYYTSAGKLRILLLSDHGNNLVASRPVPLRRFLQARGWRLRDSLETPRDVAVPAYGLVGFMAVYCQRESVQELAHTLIKLEGVDFLVHRMENGVAIESPRGRAVLGWTPDGKQFRYRVESGDPLALAPVLAKPKAAGKITREGYVSDADLFVATARHVYPDPGYRLWQWAENHVRNPADIMVSLLPGYHYGRPAFERFVTLLSTHGSLERAQTLGFAMSTDTPLPPLLRSGDLLPADLTKSRSAREK